MKIAYILTPHMLATSVTWPAEMWTAAEQRAKIINSKAESINSFQIANTREAVKTQSGLYMLPDESLASELTAKTPQTYDVIYVPALWRNPKLIIKQSALLIEWLSKQYEQGAILCGVGTGCSLLAETGLLDFKPATTHWYYFDEFEQNYPNVKLKRQHFITHAGSLYCAASINSLADLTVHFIQRAFGKDVAQHVERHFSHEVRRDYDIVNFNDQQNMNHPDETILQAQLWLQDHMSESITISNVATQFGMSERQFNRRFITATDSSPNQYLQRIRIDTAQDLLHYSNLNISEVAERVGFNDLSYFAKVFRKHRDISPKEYRQTVRAKLFSADDHSSG